MTAFELAGRRRTRVFDKQLHKEENLADNARSSEHHNDLPSSLRSLPQPSQPRMYIDNPLSRFSPPQLESAVRAFAETTGQNGISDMLVKGAKLAQNPKTWRQIPGLTQDEREVLEDDSIRRFFGQTKELQVTLVACACAAVVQGWDQASLNGANLRWPEDLNLARGLDSRDTHAIWMFAFVNASPYLFASLIGAWLTDPLNEWFFGRRAAIFVAALFSLITVVGSACVQNIAQLLVCRILLGIGLGAKASVVPILAAESAPARTRGALVMNWQLFVALGIFLGHSANLAVFDIRSLNWRLQLAAAALPALPLCVLIFVCPESPRFLIKKRKWRKAFRSLCYLNRLPLLAAKEMILIHTQIQEESRVYAQAYPKPGDGEENIDQDDEDAASLAEQKNVYVTQRATTYVRRATQLFTIPRIRRATIAAFSVMIGQQLCGVNVMSFYSATIVSGGIEYRDPEEERYKAWKKSLLISWGIGLTNFMQVFAWPAYVTIDRWGRRALLLLTIPFLAVTLLAAAFCFKIPDEVELPAIAIFLILFMIFYSPGLGPVPFVYSAEAFPLVNREVGMSLSVSANLGGAGILSLFVPFLNVSLGPTGLLCLFAGLNIVAFILVWLFVYETKESMLEELNSTFDVPILWHIRYQWRVVLPWIRRKIMREKDVDMVEPLHRWYVQQRVP